MQLNKWVREPILIEDMNKIPHNVKGIIKLALFFTLKCEKGQMHEDKVKFDQVNSAAIEGVDHFERKHNVNGGEIIWWRKP